MTSVLGLVLISMSACLMPKSVPQGLGATPEGHPVEVEHQQRWQRKVDKLPFREAHLHTRRTLHGTVGGGLEGGPVVDSLRVGRSRVSRVLAHRGGASADLGGANKTVGRSNARGRPVWSGNKVTRSKNRAGSISKKICRRSNSSRLGLGLTSAIASSNRTSSGRASTRLKKFHCPLCAYTSNRRYNLRVHMLRHSNRRLFKCIICSKTFKRLVDLQYHSLIHSGERPFRCDACGKSFRQRCHLDNHREIHSPTVQIFRCKACTKAFTKKWRLLVHHRSHSEEKPYKCLACTGGFNQKIHLVSHIKKHISGGQGASGSLLYNDPMFDGLFRFFLLVSSSLRKTVPKLSKLTATAWPCIGGHI